MVTHILFELCLFRYLVQSTYFRDTLYFGNSLDTTRSRYDIPDENALIIVDRDILDPGRRHFSLLLPCSRRGSPDPITNSKPTNPDFHECFDQIEQVFKILFCFIRYCLFFRQKQSDCLICKTFKILSLGIGCWIR